MGAGTEGRPAGGVLLAAGAVLFGVAVVGAVSSPSVPVAIVLIGVAAVAAATGAFTIVRARRDPARSVEGSRQAEDQLEEHAAALRTEIASRDTVLSAMTEGVVLFAPDGSIAYANAAARTILGRRFGSAQEVTPVALREAVLSASEASPLVVPDVRAANAAEPEPIVRQFETVRGIVEATVVPSSPPGTVVVVARDVTGAHRVERLRRDFVANASHELKTPVASILAIAETLRHAAADDPAAMERFLALLEQEAIRLSRLVRDLLELSRLEGEPSEPTVVRLDNVVNAEAERLRRRAEMAGLSFVVEHLEPVEVVGSEADLALLAHNLVDNAIRYTPTGGEVRISLERSADAAVMQVDDTGIGIPSSSLDRVFERFYRVDPARSRETGGTGLGLAIVRHVAESHLGEVRVESILGAGSTFTVRLPLSTRRGRVEPRSPFTAGTQDGDDPPDQVAERSGSSRSIT